MNHQRVKHKMFKLSLELVSLILFFLPSLVHPENSSESSVSTTPKINYLNLDTKIICKFQPNGYDCDLSRKVYPKFYFDLKLEDCRTFNIGSCPNNLNAFETLSECHQTCRDVGTHTLSRNLPIRVFCRLQQDFGHCNEYHPRWYYDLTSRTCKGFSYSGCGGNLNRFMNQQLCIATCVSLGQSGFE